jgi:N6-adenosine-specific RNA methylase IME4
MSSIVHEEGPTRINFLSLLDDSSTPVIMTPRREHSRKPDIVRDMITRLLGDIPRVEMFARTQSEGWSTMGNQIQHFVSDQQQKELATQKYQRARKKQKKAVCTI